MPPNPVPFVVLRPPGREPYTLSLDTLTAHVRAARTLKMGRLSDKLARARDAIDALDLATERDVDKIITRTEELHAKREIVMTRKHVSLDERMTDLTEFGQDLDDFGKNDRSGAGGSSSGSAYDGTNPKTPKT